jgi:hypothetical protein
VERVVRYFSILLFTGFQIYVLAPKAAQSLMALGVVKIRRKQHALGIATFAFVQEMNVEWHVTQHPWSTAVGSSWLWVWAIGPEFEIGIWQRSVTVATVFI